MMESLDYTVKNLLENIAKNQRFEEYTLTETTGPQKGDGYFGNISALKMEGICDSEKKILNLIVKSTIKGEVLRNVLPVAEAYHREIYMYETLIPAFQELLLRKRLPPLDSFVKCFGTTLEENHETLVLQNINPEGFKLWNRKVPADEEHVSLVMKTLGQFHALSFALKDQEANLFNILVKPLKNVDIRLKFFERENYQENVDHLLNFASDALDARDDAAVIKAFESLKVDAFEFYKKILISEDEFSVVLHKDCWMNNILFSYDDAQNPRVPTRLCLIDLQMSGIGPPVIDLLFFFYSSSSKEIITNFEHFLNIYYKSFSTFLEALGSDPKKLYPYEVFRHQWQSNAKYGLISAMYLLHLMLAEEEEIGDLANIIETGSREAFDSSTPKMREYHSRVKDIILHFYDNKFI